jgi:trans-aconitate 2-methyltransferase
MEQRSRAGDKWDPDQYARFSSERAKPFFDLLSLVEPCPGGNVTDLGCGTGELTARLHEHTRATTTIGIDNSVAMLAKAIPRAGNGLRFELGDISRFAARNEYDVVFANASLQWVPNHPELLRRLAAGLRTAGQIAVQVPANGDHPSHALADEVAKQTPFVDHLGMAGETVNPVCAPERYSQLLKEIGFSNQHVRLQVYGHELDTTAAVVEWTKGTTLLRFQNLLPPQVFDNFLERYRERVIEVLGSKSPYFYTFKRILIWGRLAEDDGPAGSSGDSHGLPERA